MTASSLFDLSGKTALVTGSSGGLGLAMARGLAEAGAAVIVNGRDEAKLAAAAHAFESAGLGVSARAFDVADEAAVRGAFERFDAKGIAVFLASSASDYVNGQIIYVDGGLLAVI